MLRIVLFVVLAIVAVLALVITLQPAAFVIERSTTIEAPPSVIYPHLVSPRAQNVWSPFVQGDPQMKLEYSGPESGVGAKSAWQSPQRGNGSMTVTQAAQDREVDLQLDFLRPMKATNQARFTLEPAGSGTRVSWRMEGRNGFVGKAFSLAMNMDKLVGGEFEKGLASLKTLAESEARGGS
jgi:polyketide cyclase/dehydrase/lipid transport protein